MLSAVLPLFATATLFVGLLASGVLLTLRWRVDHRLEDRSFVLQWALGFFFFALVNLPVVLINLGLSASFSFIPVFFSMALLAALAATLFFYRATVSILTPSRIARDVFPLALYLGFAVIFLTLFLQEREKAPTLLGLFVVALSIPRDLFLSTSFFHFFLHGFRGPETARRIGPLLISMAWIGILILNVVVWFELFRYPPDFWAIRLSSLGWWYVARFFVTAMLFAGFLPLPPKQKAFFEP